MKRLLLLATALTLAGCNLNTSAPPADNPSDPATETFASSLNVNISTMTKTQNGVYYRDLVVGSGATLTGSPSVLFTYAGFLKTGSLFGQEQITTPMPLSALVFGVQEGMQGMKEGGERLMVIPSALGYGPNQVSTIPANSTLIFDIRLDQIP